MGNHTFAADFYRKTLDFVIHPSRRYDYDDSDFYREQLKKEERRPDCAEALRARNAEAVRPLHTRFVQTLSV
ncbi:MAG TPA: hypothetical protein VN253_17240 [Kofleriaceae bacterium]|nr:hypothetical protein [Kofleriaceae bacterium]